MLKEHHDACYPFVWYETTEEDRIIRENRKIFPEDVQFFCWDIMRGFSRVTDEGIYITVKSQDDIAIQDRPRNALESIHGMPGNSIIFMKDFHRFFDQISIFRQALNIKETLKTKAQTITFLSALTNIPSEMRNDIQVLDYPLPGIGTLEEILRIMADDNEITLIKADIPRIVNALKGLTWEGAENALARSLVQYGRFDVQTLLRQKESQFKTGGIVEFGHYNETFGDLYGVDNITEFILKTAHSLKARGVLIYGFPGTAKSHIAKAAANELGVPCLILRFSALKDKYQGVAEGRLKEFFKIRRAIGNCVVFMDECEAIATGISTGGDNGVGQALYKDLLIEMEDARGSGAYFIGTCNSLDPLIRESGGAILRRFNATFFCDLPDEEQAQGIARIWNKKEGVEIPEDFPLEGYTGANIAQLAETISMMGCSAEEASKFILPYGKAHSNEVKKIREKAGDTCIWASSKKGEIFPTLKGKRKVNIAG